ncbi:hypothetical protein BDA96_09G257700 [Sorghum bicolor]|uniref:DUF1645 domain-containing protein n=1 Tax=Sorghum bicolor TaxID=4558 RepID=A0A921QCP6_SORBI|nr:hypothetical protein BDA96_09G257700 [Sorghum bicolor]
MEERIPQRPREAQAPTVAEPAPTTGKPCDDGDALAPAIQLLSSSSSGEESSDDEGELEFEFPFVSRDSPAGTAAPADELFADGRIRTFYPVFGRGASSHGGCTTRPAAPAAAPPRVRGQLGKLFLEETRERNSSTSSTSSSSSSSGAATDDDGLEGVAPESYCVWRPGSSASPSPPTPPRKSGSTGSMARWLRISDLAVGRSHSDGREKFLFLAAAPAHDAPRRSKKPAPVPARPAGARKPAPSAAVAAADADTAAAHRIAHLARGGLGVPVPPGGTPRRTFLPYREELVGFFANVNGISRSHHHPF